jgi:hypothetical protein
MITQDIKSNINKIDYDLSNLFENVYISEKTSGSQFYFEIKVNSTFFNICESMDWKRAEVIINISKKDLSSNVVKWSYSANPMNESSDMIERISDINNIAKDIFEIVTKSKMEKSYFESLESIVESINENNSIEITKDDLIEKLKQVAIKHGILVSKSDKELIIKESIGESTDMTISLYHNSNVRISDMFKIESDICSIPGVNFALFKDSCIKINCTR